MILHRNYTVTIKLECQVEGEDYQECKAGMRNQVRYDLLNAVNNGELQKEITDEWEEE